MKYIEYVLVSASISVILMIALGSLLFSIQIIQSIIEGIKKMKNKTNNHETP